MNSIGHEPPNLKTTEKDMTFMQWAGTFFFFFFFFFLFMPSSRFFCSNFSFFALGPCVEHFFFFFLTFQYLAFFLFFSALLVSLKLSSFISVLVSSSAGVAQLFSFFLIQCFWRGGVWGFFVHLTFSLSLSLSLTHLKQQLPKIDFHHS